MKKKPKVWKAKTAKADIRDLSTIIIKIKGTFRDDIRNIGGRGELLQQAKEQIEHGGWLTWLETNFNWDEEMAQRAMSVAKFAAKYDAVTRLSVSFSRTQRSFRQGSVGTELWNAALSGSNGDANA